MTKHMSKKGMENHTRKLRTILGKSGGVSKKERKSLKINTMKKTKTKTVKNKWEF